MATFSVLSVSLLPAAASQVAEAHPYRMALVGSAPTAAKDGKSLGHKDHKDMIDVTVTLKLRNQAGLDAYLADVYNPHSRAYKHFLTPQAFNSMFGPTQQDVEQVTQFLKQSGLQVLKGSPEGRLIHVRGNVSNVENTFGVTINNYRNHVGETYYANNSSPLVPTALSNVIMGIQGLDNEAHWTNDLIKGPSRQSSPLSTARASGQPNPANTTNGFNLFSPLGDLASPGFQSNHTQHQHLGSGPVGGYTPTELRSAYDVTPLTKAGVYGTGQTVALFELDGFKQSNISTFDTHYGLGSPTPSTVLVDGYNGAAGSGEGEVELDLEVVQEIAPRANVAVYEGPNTDAGAIDTYQRIANDDKAKSVSTSWGESELLSNASTMNSLHSIFQQMAAQGQSIYAAAGDSGAYDGGSYDPNHLAVDSPANDPFVTSVGGTHLLLGSGGYGSESVWSNHTDKSGGGGGLSTVYSKPSWQIGPGTNNSYSNGNRQVPDVSADADPSTGYSVYSGGQWAVYGGTSAAAPLFAGITALNNEYAVAKGKPRLGQANPALYKLFHTAQTYPAFHDVTSGTNLYYPATAGYDQASGIGTPDVYNMVRDLNGATSSTGGTTTSPTPAPIPAPTHRPTPAPVPAPTATQLVRNGGFENGSTSWIQASSGGYSLMDTADSHTGSYAADLGGYNSASDTLYQTITIPSTANRATFSFWSDVSTQELYHAYDFLNVQVRDANGKLLKTLQTQSDATVSGWKSQSFDLSAYKGKTIRIYFIALTDAINPTSFFIDDVGLIVK